jgi:hypothetical protein
MRSGGIGAPAAHDPGRDAERVERVPERAAMARGGRDGARRHEPGRPRRPTSAPLRQELVHRRRPAQAVGREALHAVVARQPAGEDAGPDGRRLRRAAGGQGAVRAAAHDLPKAESPPRATPSRICSRLSRRSDQDDAARRGDRLRRERDRCRPRHRPRAHGQGQHDRGRRRQHDEGGGDPASARREEDGVDPDREQHERGRGQRDRRLGQGRETSTGTEWR